MRIDGDELCRCGDGATVQHNNHAKKQDQGGKQESKNSVVQRTLSGGASGRRGGVAERTTLSIRSTRCAEKSKNNEKRESKTHWPSVGQALLPVLSYDA